MGVLPGQRLAAFVGNRRVKILVLLFGNFFFALTPKSGLVVQARRFFCLHFAFVVFRRLVVQENAVGNELAVFADDGFHAPFRGKFLEVFAVFQVEGDFCADFLLGHIGNFVVPRSVRTPKIAGFFAGFA